MDPSELERFERTLLPHMRAAYNLARWLTRTDQDAEDVVQEAYLRAVRFFGGFRGGDAKAWLLTIVRNTSHSAWQRGRGAGATVPLDEDTPEVEDAALGPEDLLLQKASGQEVSEALDALPVEFREVVECELCAAALRSHRALRSALADASLYYEAPKGLEDRVRTELRKASKESKRSAVAGWRWGAVAASLPVIAALAWALVAVPRGPSNDELVNQEVVSAHVRSLMAEHLTDVASSDRHTVKPWFNGKLDFSPEVKDLAGEGYPLVGGRLDYIGRRGVAALVYQRGAHPINVFIWPEPDARGGDGESSLQGYNVIRWRRSGMRYWAVSDLNLPELRELARDLQRP